jgi:TolA-binding protein
MQENLDVQQIGQAEIEWKRKHERFLEELADLLPPCIADEVNITLQVKRLLDVEERLRSAERENERIKKEYEKEVSELKKEIKQLRDDLETQQKQNITIQTNLEKLELKAEGMTGKQAIQTTLSPLLEKKKLKRKPEPKSRFAKLLQRMGL